MKYWRVPGRRGVAAGCAVEKGSMHMYFTGAWSGASLSCSWCGGPVVSDSNRWVDDIGLETLPCFPCFNLFQQHNFSGILATFGSSKLIFIYSWKVSEICHQISNGSKINGLVRGKFNLAAHSTVPVRYVYITHPLSHTGTCARTFSFGSESLPQLLFIGWNDLFQ